MNYGVNYFYEHMKEAGMDLVKEPYVYIEQSMTAEVYNVLTNLIYSGYLAECSMNRKAPDLDKEQIRHFVLSGDDESATELFYSIQACRSGMGVDEFKKFIKDNQPEEKKNPIAV